MIVHLCVCLYVGQCSPVAMCVHQQHSSLSYTRRMRLWGYAVNCGDSRGVMLCHGFLNAQHTLRGRGCTIEGELLFPFVVHAKVCFFFFFCLHQCGLVCSLAQIVVTESIWFSSQSIEEKGQGPHDSVSFTWWLEIQAIFETMQEITWASGSCILTRDTYCKSENRTITGNMNPKMKWNLQMILDKKYKSRINCGFPFHD